MNKTAKAILERCANSCNKVDKLLPSCSLSITPSRFGFYHNLSTSDRICVHECLDILEKDSDWLKIYYQRRGFDEIPILEKLEVFDSSKLLSELNLAVLSEQLDNYSNLAQQQLLSSPAWLQDALCDLPNCWRQNKTNCGFSWKQYDSFVLGIKLVNWAESQEQLNTDLRTASVKALGDTKILERNLPFISKLLRLKSNDKFSDLSDMEVLADWGITKFAPLIRISGNCEVTFDSGSFDTAIVSPYVAIPMDNILSIKAKGTPEYVIFIENLVSYERYCRTVKDTGLAIYTGGFPSKHWVRVVRTLTSSLKATCSLYHWGDIDEGGYKIMAFITKSLSIDLIPFRMMGNLSEESSREISLSALIKILEACETPNLLKLQSELRKLEAENTRQYWVEQESLDPISPLDISVV